ncbi:MULTISPECIES: 3'(2'),5'-bisphosphate nucleotidase CysQ [unclassified Pseudomonas]|uniref:3'(2'),5'-bisphosphate nucleotidase CysQ n=1 Tax=unclassified Pseudomonas TaxID=196821 RepID=UPI000C87EB60|nr:MULTISPECIES: 3'(2'),5'-bisphosphate nucleotidase CysQ [unclassified Pseudomonas]PMZ96560.1 3'(2'),5'-bisphosphate nucleotidase [Pseudomonas sp. FW305-42]PNA21831.1 3'(2'),5'-bisphosphate nucleotidase [Pseudomonas sp. MPR-R1B]PNB29205.1 3'(2'),5'-bisphosphate nucleotidase [Pseudomonas sp. DP16D-E2]PNB44379.1 3'(2'),5'-bisphosphate nucleotidase [Pseudomonas sp. FW305-17]PNB58382.1 3'(2'),5'-bisphosphate nucleotidase [Pseudomonas sp. GW531-E2]
MNDRQLMQDVAKLALVAGEATLPFWRADVAVSNKADDSPVTAADLAAHRVIADGLQALAPQIPVLSEEDCDIPLATRAGWQRWWLVDPLDGTKEFIAGSEEFTVNIALIENGEVVFGVVAMPTNGRCYFGGREFGAWRAERNEEAQTIQVRNAPPAQERFTVVASRRHSSPEQEALLAGLGSAVGELELANIGSSLKFCLLAEGSADCYPRLAPTSQWDTAAAQGVLEGAGGEVIGLDGLPFRYPPRESLLNPFFLALPRAAEWRQALVELASAIKA